MEAFEAAEPSSKPGEGLGFGHSSGAARRAGRASPGTWKPGVSFKRSSGCWSLRFAQAHYERLILVGPSRFVGMLRAKLSAPVLRQLTDTLPKDFAMLEDKDVWRRACTNRPPGLGLSSGLGSSKGSNPSG